MPCFEGFEDQTKQLRYYKRLNNPSTQVAKKGQLFSNLVLIMNGLILALIFAYNAIIGKLSLEIDYQ